MKRVVVILLPMISLVYANTSYDSDYEQILKLANHRIEYLSSEDDGVQVEIVRHNHDNKRSYVNKILFCGLDGCKTYEYEPDEVQLIPIVSEYAKFKAKINNGLLSGYICDKNAVTNCSSHVDLQVNKDKKIDDHVGIVMHHEKSIVIKKSYEDYL